MIKQGLRYHGEPNCQAMNAEQPSCGSAAQARALVAALLGDSHFDKVKNVKFGMLPSCCILLTDFKTVFVFALGPFLPM